MNSYNIYVRMKALPLQFLKRILHISVGPWRMILSHWWITESSVNVDNLSVIYVIVKKLAVWITKLPVQFYKSN